MHIVRANWRWQKGAVSRGMRSARPWRFVVCVAPLVVALACQTVPITGRQQLQLVSADELNSMSLKAYRDFLSTHKVVSGTPEALMVQRVGRHVQRAVETYFARRNLNVQLRGYAWEFHTVQDNAKNAWCMPGGKVVVYTGILPVTRDENGLAVVLGHEIAHALANHGNERMSQELLINMGGAALSTAIKQQPAQARDLFFKAFGVGSQVGLLLPYSRLHESEADRLGLIFMALAGYDPHGAVDFWNRMMQQKQGGAVPDLLSTHPSDQTRINNLKALMPEAMGYYRAP